MVSGFRETKPKTDPGEKVEIDILNISMKVLASFSTLLKIWQPTPPAGLLSAITSEILESTNPELLHLSKSDVGKDTLLNKATKKLRQKAT